MPQHWHVILLLRPICFSVCFPVLLLARMVCTINVTVINFYKVLMLSVVMILGNTVVSVGRGLVLQPKK